MDDGKEKEKDEEEDGERGEYLSLRLSLMDVEALNLGDTAAVLDDAVVDAARLLLKPIEEDALLDLCGGGGAALNNGSLGEDRR